MKIYEIKETNKIEKWIRYVECDSCHNKIYYNDLIEWQEILFIEFTGGYGSVFGDETTMETQLCQTCVKKILGNVLRIRKEE